MVQAIILQPWRLSSRQSLAASEEALDQPWLAGKPWINPCGVRAMPSLVLLHSTPGDRNYRCTLWIMCGTIAFHLELAPRRLPRRLPRRQRKPGLLRQVSCVVCRVVSSIVCRVVSGSQGERPTSTVDDLDDGEGGEEVAVSERGRKAFLERTTWFAA